MRKRILQLTQAALWAVLGAGAISPAFGEDFVIPHFAQGVFDLQGIAERQFVLKLLVFNPTSEELPVAIEAFDDRGERVPLAVGGPNLVRPLGLGRYSVSVAGLASGWLRVTTAGSAVVRASIQFREVVNFDPPPVSGFPTSILTETDADPVPALLRAAVPVLFDAKGGTGIALALPSSDSEGAAVNLTLRDGDGQTLGVAEVSLPANGRSVFLAEDVFPELRQAGAGTLELSSSRPFFGTAIRFQSDPVYLSTVALARLPEN